MSGFSTLLNVINPWGKTLAPWNLGRNQIAGLSGNAPSDRPQHPWLQQVARNEGHAVFGDKIGDAVDTRFLHDQITPSTNLLMNPMGQQQQTPDVIAWLMSQGGGQ